MLNQKFAAVLVSAFCANAIPCVDVAAQATAVRDPSRVVSGERPTGTTHATRFEPAFVVPPATQANGESPVQLAGFEIGDSDQSVTPHTSIPNIDVSPNKVDSTKNSASTAKISGSASTDAGAGTVAERSPLRKVEANTKNVGQRSQQTFPKNALRSSSRMPTVDAPNVEPTSLSKPIAASLELPENKLLENQDQVLRVENNDDPPPSPYEIANTTAPPSALVAETQNEPVERLAAITPIDASDQSIEPLATKQPNTTEPNTTEPNTTEPNTTEASETESARHSSPAHQNSDREQGADPTPRRSNDPPTLILGGSHSAEDKLPPETETSSSVEEQEIIIGSRAISINAAAGRNPEPQSVPKLESKRPHSNISLESRSPETTPPETLSSNQSSVRTPAELPKSLSRKSTLPKKSTEFQIEDRSVDIADDPEASLEQESPMLSKLDLEDGNDDENDKDRLEQNISDGKSATKRPTRTEVPIQKVPEIYSSERIQFSQAELQLKNRIETCLAYYISHPESVEARSPWAVMHALLPLGVETDLTSRNQRVNAIGWTLYNGKCRTQRMFSLTRNGGFKVASGPGVQGHEGQLLAMLAQSFVAADYPIRVGNRSFTVADLVRYEMAGCRPNSELTFQLLGISHYASTDASWRSSDGQNWNVSRLIAEELDQQIIGSACGGTHRLMALTYAVKRRQQEGLKIDGQFRRAAIFIDEFLKYAWTLQNPDGSFSTDWFAGRADKSDLERKVQTTGHIVEWMVYTLPAEQLRHPQFQKSIQFLLSQVLDRREKAWPIGPRGHALHALAMYQEKVFGAKPGERKTELARLIRQTSVMR